MVVVQRTARPAVQLPRIDLDLKAFGGKVYNLPNIIDPVDTPGQLLIVALADGFESEIAHSAAMIQAIMGFEQFKDLASFLRKLSFQDQMDIILAWLGASKDAVSVDPKASSSSTSS